LSPDALKAFIGVTRAHAGELVSQSQPQSELVNESNVIALSGKSLFSVKPSARKYSDLQNQQIGCIFFAIPPRTKGAFAIVTDVRRREAVDASGALTNALRADVPSRVVLTPRGRRQVGGRRCRPYRARHADTASDGVNKT
jgi:hypothetical protein